VWHPGPHLRTELRGVDMIEGYDVLRILRTALRTERHIISQIDKCF
jgi:hypothetical protein